MKIKTKVTAFLFLSLALTMLCSLKQEEFGSNEQPPVKKSEHAPKTDKEKRIDLIGERILCIDCHFYQDSHGDGNVYAR